jgi:hypothetical protein
MTQMATEIIMKIEKKKAIDITASSKLTADKNSPSKPLQAALTVNKVYLVPTVMVIPMFDQTADSGTFYAISTVFPVNFPFFTTENSMISREGVSCTFRRYNHFNTMASLFEQNLVTAKKTLDPTYLSSATFFHDAPKTVTVGDTPIKSASHAIAIISRMKKDTTKEKKNRPVVLSACLSKLNEAYAILRDFSAADPIIVSALTALVAVLDDFYYPIVVKLTDIDLSKSLTQKEIDVIETDKVLYSTHIAKQSVLFAKNCGVQRVSWYEWKYPRLPPTEIDEEGRTGNCNDVAVFDPTTRVKADKKANTKEMKVAYAKDKGYFQKDKTKTFDTAVLPRDVQNYCFPIAGQPPLLAKPRGKKKLPVIGIL